MEFITTNTKKEIKINPASFKDAANLRKATLKCLQKAGIIEGLELNNTSLLNYDIADLIPALGNLVINLDTSDEFERALFVCLEKCIYDNSNKINADLFDAIPTLREDYYEIATKCIEVNLAPFFKSLFSAFKTKLNQLGAENQ